MLKVVIIEDEEVAYSKLSMMLSASRVQIEIISWLQSVAASIDWLMTNKGPDVIFLDVELADGNCFAIFEKIQINCPIIFTTAYDEYALKAFELNSIDYLLKPFTQEHLNRALEKLHLRTGPFFLQNEEIKDLIRSFSHSTQSNKERFHVSRGKRIIIVKTEDIAWFHLDKYVYLMTKKGERLHIDYSLDHLMSVLNPKFFYRVNRQFIVNIDALDSVVSHYSYKLKLVLTPPCPAEIFVPKDRARAFKEWLG